MLLYHKKKILSSLRDPSKNGEAVRKATVSPFLRLYVIYAFTSSVFSLSDISCADPSVGSEKEEG